MAIDTNCNGTQPLQLDPRVSFNPQVKEHGCLVLTLWCGILDPSLNYSITNDTLFPSYSVTKYVLAAGLTLQEDRWYFSWDDFVSKN